MKWAHATRRAPPVWEWRLVPFLVTPDPGTLDYQNKNQQIPQVLRADPSVFAAATPMPA